MITIKIVNLKSVKQKNCEKWEGLCEQTKNENIVQQDLWEIL